MERRRRDRKDGQVKEKTGYCGYVRRDGVDHKVHIYTEYHSVCPLVGIGTLPPPLSRQ